MTPSQPRFIETVPKHGYRFIAPVEVLRQDESGDAHAAREASERWREFVVTSTAGIVGGVVAGAIGGLIYGFAGASEPLRSGPGALSILMVLLCVTSLVALIGAAGVSVGIAMARFARPGSLLWTVVGGAAGGLVVGAFGKLLGLDAFTLLVGRSPGNITGASEGALIGAAVGCAAALALETSSARRAGAIAAACGAAAGIVISLLGGRLMLGSLEGLSHGFPASRLRLDLVSHPFTQPMLNQVAHLVASGAEAALFSVGVVVAIAVARRKLLRPVARTL